MLQHPWRKSPWSPHPRVSSPAWKVFHNVSWPILSITILFIKMPIFRKFSFFHSVSLPILLITILFIKMPIFRKLSFTQCMNWTYFLRFTWATFSLGSKASSRLSMHWIITNMSSTPKIKHKDSLRLNEWSFPYIYGLNLRKNHQFQEEGREWLDRHRWWKVRCRSKDQRRPQARDRSPAFQRRRGKPFSLNVRNFLKKPPTLCSIQLRLQRTMEK